MRTAWVRVAFRKFLLRLEPATSEVKGKCANHLTTEAPKVWYSNWYGIIWYGQWRSQPDNLISPAMQIQNYYHHSFLWKLIVFTVNEHENICIVGLNHRAGYTPLGMVYWYGIVWLLVMQ